MDKLFTLELAERIAKTCDYFDDVLVRGEGDNRICFELRAVTRQLADVLRENKRLITVAGELLTYIRKGGLPFPSDIYPEQQHKHPLDELTAETERLGLYDNQPKT